MCKICNVTISSEWSLKRHVKLAHNMAWHDYQIEHLKMEVPKCCICGEDASRRSGNLRFNKTCKREDCRGKLRSASQRNMSVETKAKIRKARIEYLKSDQASSAWRLGNKMSVPEQRFYDLILGRGLLDKFLVVRELSVYPYYIDFAFPDIMVAIEIDGSQHERPEAVAYDETRDAALTLAGWRVMRIPARQIQDVGLQNSILENVENFLSGDLAFHRSGLKTGAEYRREQKQEQQRLLKQSRHQQKRESKKSERGSSPKKNSREERDADIASQRKQLVLNAGIDYRCRGSNKRIAELLGVSHTQARRFIIKHLTE